MKLSELLTQFLDDLAYRRSGSEHTRSNYKRDLESFFVWLNTDDSSSLSSLSSFDLQRYFTTRAKSGLAARTVAHERAAISSFYRFLLRRGVVDKNPVKPTKVAKPDKSLPKALPEIPLNRKLDEILVNLEMRERWILEGLYGTGLRVSEFAALRYKDIRPAERRLEVKGKGAKVRSVPLTNRAWETLNAYLLERGGSPALLGISDEPILIGIHGKSLTVRTIQRVISQLLSVLRDGTGVTPHQLRHSYASHLLAGGAELRAVQELLGHARLATTQIYTHLDPAPLQEMVRKKHPRGGTEPQEES